MSAEGDFLSGALGRIGAARITNINDGTVPANWCKSYYPSLRKALLRSNFWNFAEARSALIASETSPAFEWAYAYPLPPDFLRVKEYNGNLINLSSVAVDPSYWTTWAGRYKIEGTQLLSNESEVKLLYIKDVDNPLLWDSLFYQVMECLLASKLADAIKHDAAKAQALRAEALTLWNPLALAVDGQEGTVIPYTATDLLDCR